MERLQKVMARAGVASRRKSEEIIRAGRVKVNGEVVTVLGTKVDPEKDRIEVDGREISLERKVYFLLNKPCGYITTVDDPYGRKTVLDLLPDISQRIYPVGRLDMDSEGLLLFTNDGDLTYRLTHPGHEVEKEYFVQVEGRVTEKEVRQLEEGVELEDGLTAPARVRDLTVRGQVSQFRISIHEGRNRQVRRMCEKLGHPVRRLVRERIAFLTLKGLPAGRFRKLSSDEVRRLKSL